MYPETESSENNAPDDRTATRVVVMAVNPHLVHVYWQISQKDLENIRHTLHESLANARPVLRFYDITRILFDGTNARQIFDVEVDLRTMKWNVPVWSPEKSYVLDLGYKASDGRFYPIARSDIVDLPRAEPSQRLAERYLRVEGGQIKSLVPALVSHVPPEKPAEAALPETMHGTRKEPGEPLKGPVHDLSDPFDLVRLTQEKFSFGVSSPTPGTNS
jgi:hypothetical protein